MKKFLLFALLLLPFLFPQTTFAASHNHALQEMSVHAEDHTFHILLPFILILLFSLNFFKAKLISLYKSKQFSGVRFSLSSFIAIVVIFGVFATHVIPSYMLVTVHHSDQKHSSSEHHPCCAPGLASVTLNPLEDIAFTTAQKIVIHPEVIFIKPHKSSILNNSPPPFS